MTNNELIKLAQELIPTAERYYLERLEKGRASTLENIISEIITDYEDNNDVNLDKVDDELLEIMYNDIDEEALIDAFKEDKKCNKIGALKHIRMSEKDFYEI